MVMDYNELEQVQHITSSLLLFMCVQLKNEPKMDQMPVEEDVRVDLLQRQQQKDAQAMDVDFDASYVSSENL